MSNEQSFVCSGRPRLRVDVNAGSLFIRGWDGNEVRVEDGAAAQVRQKGDTIYINSSSKCDLKIYVPRLCEVSVDGTELELDMAGIRGAGVVDVTTSRVSIEDWLGDISVDGTTCAIRLSQCQGQAQLDTSGGNVELTACKGNISVDTSSGSVQVVDSSGSFSADTSGGDVSLRQFKGPVHIDTGSGNVELREISGRNVYVDTGNGDIEATLPGSSPGRWQLETGSGVVSLQVPDNSSARFEFEGQDLDVEDLALEQWRQSEDGITGSLNEGQGHVAVHARAIQARKIPAAFTLNTEPQPEKDRERDEESLKILTMLEQGTISTAEAEKLLDALRGGADSHE